MSDHSDIVERTSNDAPGPTIENMKESVDALMEEATNWLDGLDIENQGQADSVGQLLDMARQMEKQFDAIRKAWGEPHREALAKIQADFKPILGDLSKIIEGCKALVGKWLNRLEVERREKEERLARIAEEKRAEAVQAFASTDVTDIAGRKEAEHILGVANAADAALARTQKTRIGVSGGASGRRVSLRTVRHVKVVDYQAFAKYVWKSHPEKLKEWLDDYAKKIATERTPGVEITTTKEAV